MSKAPLKNRIVKSSNFTGYFLSPDRTSMGRAVVMAVDAEDAQAKVMHEAVEIYSCNPNEITLLLIHHCENSTPLFNTTLERGYVLD
ncbi:hypothetical protein [Comamonas thiooxydans]|uniref:hypothetical protein n=1 Tax=Comamonas thiooxydans TaxID=363952 RepID=UPI000AFF6E83|nr:hypothetical protein [Comamonas thiooxydans]